MKKLICVIIVALSPVFAHSAVPERLEQLFPTLDELPGGQMHWMMQIAEPSQSGSCTIYSATYAYFAKDATTLFDIPRKNIYSVNIRFHACDNTTTADNLYTKFSAVGAKEKKRIVSIGEKGIVYIEPNPKSEMLGEYYVTSLFKFIVLQVHADDGFVLMDISSLMASRLSAYLRRGAEGLSGGLTVSITGDGITPSTRIIGFRNSDASQVDFSGAVYDQFQTKVAGAQIKVLETGTTITTDKDGNFSVSLNPGKGKKAELYRLITVDRNVDAGKTTPLKSGYYNVDVNYKLSGKTSQDIWRIWIDDKGNLTGGTLQISGGKSLLITGVLDNDSLTVARPCGSTFLGVCNQNFKAQDKGGYFEGEWTGNGGGGIWRLYKKTFEEKNVLVTPEEANFKVSGKKTASACYTLSTNGTDAISLKPDAVNNEDFYLRSASLLVNMNSEGDAKPHQLCLYGKNGDKKDTLSCTQSFILTKKTTGAALNFSTAYISPKYSEYFVSFKANQDKALQVCAGLSVELKFASPAGKANTDNIFKANIISFDGKDIAGNTKVIKSDGQSDIVLRLDTSVYGVTLKGAEITSVGKGGKRIWNTLPGNFYPGVALMSGDKVLNNEDGSLYYPLEKINETLHMYINKGTLAKSDIDKLELKLYVDDKNIIIRIDNQEVSQ